MLVSLLLIILAIFGFVIWKACRHPLTTTPPVTAPLGLDGDRQQAGDRGELQAQDAAVVEMGDTSQDPRDPRPHVSHDGANDDDDDDDGRAPSTLLANAASPRAIANSLSRPPNPTPEIALLEEEQRARLAIVRTLSKLRRRLFQSSAGGGGGGDGGGGDGKYWTWSKRYTPYTAPQARAPLSSTDDDEEEEDGQRVPLLLETSLGPVVEDEVWADADVSSSEGADDDAAASAATAPPPGDATPSSSSTKIDIPGTAADVIQQQRSGGEHPAEIEYSSVKTVFRWR